MGYQGEEEFLCEQGHHHVINAAFFSYGGWPQDATCKHDEQGELRCNHCGGAMTWTHSIDYTNGSEPDQPDTNPAPLEEVGFTNVWHKDHLENGYATKLFIYKPSENSGWKLISEIRAEQEREEAEHKAKTRYYIQYQTHNPSGTFRDFYALSLKDGVWTFHSWSENDYEFDLEADGLLFESLEAAEQYLDVNRTTIAQQCGLNNILTYAKDGNLVDVVLTVGRLSLTEAA